MALTPQEQSRLDELRSMGDVQPTTAGWTPQESARLDELRAMDRPESPATGGLTPRESSRLSELRAMGEPQSTSPSLESSDTSRGLTPQESSRLQELRAMGEPQEDEGNSIAETATALAADIAIAESGRLGGAAVGSAILPGVGTAIGYVVGGLGSGALGSYTRQKMLGDDINYGALVADALINLIPVPKGFKVLGNKTLDTALFQGAAGAGIATGGETVTKIISEDRLPTVEEMKSSAVGGLMLGAGLGAVGSKFNDAYIKYAGQPRDELHKAYRAGDADAKTLVDGTVALGRQQESTVKSRFGELLNNIKEGYSDARVRLNALQKTAGGGQIVNKKGKLEVDSDDVDYTLNSRLAESVIQNKNREMSDVVELDAKFLVAKAKELNVDPSDLSRQVDNYLYAQHAVQFNKAKKGKYKGEGSPSGLDTKDALKIIKDFESSGLKDTLSSSLDARRGLSRQILDTLVDGGIISKKRAANLRKDYPNYVPLNRVAEDMKFKPGQYAAVGSSREVNDIGNNILGNLSAAIRFAETNKANQAFLGLLQRDANKSAAEGIAKIYKKSDKDPELKANLKENRDSFVKVYKNGEQYYVGFKDKRMAAAMQGKNKEVVGGILKVAMNVNRFLGSMYTRWNPEFGIPNLSRDRSEAFVNSMSKIGLRKSLGLLNPVAGIRGIIGHRRNLRKNPNAANMSKDEALYKQFVADGGSTGNIGATTADDIEKNIAKLKELSNNPRSKSFIKSLADTVEGINGVLEDSTRFSVYKRGLDSGMTRKQAALSARDSSFDPLVQGSKAERMKALYLFFNPAVQGSKTFLRSLKNPRTLIATTGSLTGLSLAFDLYNQSIDKDWREKLQTSDGSSWRTDKSFTIVTGKNDDGTLQTFSIPIGYAIAPFKKMADYAQKKGIQPLMGIEPSQFEMDSTPTKDALGLMGAFADSYNPTGGSLVPTPVRPWLELKLNEDGLGRDIRPKWLEQKNISATEKVYPWTMDTYGGEMAINFAEQIKNMGGDVSPESLKYLYQTVTGGPGSTVSKLFNVTAKLYDPNKEIKAKDFPVIRRFFGESSKQAFEARNYDASFIDQLDFKYGTINQAASRVASQTWSKMKGKPVEEQKLLLQDAISANPDVGRRIFDSVMRKMKQSNAGLTSADMRVKNLTPAARAEFFLKRIEEMPPEKVNDYLSAQRDMGVLSDKTLETMMEFNQFKEAFR